MHLIHLGKCVSPRNIFIILTLCIKKSTYKMVKGLRILMFLVFVAITSSWGKTPLQETIASNLINEGSAKFLNKPVGVWEYTVFGAEAPYDKGVLFVNKSEGMFTVDVKLTHGTLTGQDVQVDSNTIKFNMNIEGMERVSVVLIVKDDEISGEAYSNQGTFKIQGKRKLPSQKN